MTIIWRKFDSLTHNKMLKRPSQLPFVVLHFLKFFLIIQHSPVALFFIFQSSDCRSSSCLTCRLFVGILLPPELSFRWWYFFDLASRPSRFLIGWTNQSSWLHCALVFGTRTGPGNTYPSISIWLNQN